MLACDIKMTKRDKKWGCCMLLFNPNNPDKVLVCKRAPGERQEPGSWGFAGGKVAIGETADEAVVREVKEETGITVYHYKYLGSFVDGVYTDFIFVATSWSGAITLDPEECSDYEWVTLSDIKDQVVRNESTPIFSFTQSTVKFYEDWCDSHK